MLGRSAVMLMGIAVIVAVQTPPAAAQGSTLGQRPVRLEGSWDHVRRDPGFIGDVTLSADGAATRTFGIRALQAYRPEEEGIQVLRATGLQPLLLVRGTRALVARLFAARADQRITILATYFPGSASLLLGSIEVTDAPPPAS